MEAGSPIKNATADADINAKPHISATNESTFVIAIKFMKPHLLSLNIHGAVFLFVNKIFDHGI
jgi:hypothetical protein